MKKIISLFLVLTMLCGLLAACGSSDTDTAEEAESTESSEEATEETETETTEEAEAETTEEAETAETESEEVGDTAEDDTAAETEAETEETVTVSYPISEETIELTMWVPQPTLGPLRAWGGDYGVDIYEDYASIQAAAEITGVTVSFENANDTDGTLFALHVAAGDWADMLAMVDNYYTGGVTAAYADEVILDISEYAETWAPDYLRILEEDETLEKSVRTDEGQILHFAQIYNRSVIVQGLVIRTDWLDEVNMDMPTTVDELTEVLTAFKTELGCTNPFYLNSACKQLASAYNVVQYTDLESNDLAIYQIDGTVYSTFIAEDYRSCLETLNEWYEAGLVDPDFFSVAAEDNGGHDEELLMEDDLGVWWANANSVSNYYNFTSDEDYAIAGLYVTGTDDPVNHTWSTSRLMTSSTSVGGTAISATCSNPEAAVAWLNFWYTEEGYMLQNYGVEGDSYELVDGEVQYTEVITDSAFDLEPTVALLLYSTAAAPWGYSIQERTWPFYTENQTEIIETWTNACDGAWEYPIATLTTDESAVISAKSADICTYIAESIPRFIMGEYNLEEDWDTYVENCISMGLEDCIAAYQSALDRYNER